jgi:hypothetical protein
MIGHPEMRRAIAADRQAELVRAVQRNQAARDLAREQAPVELYRRAAEPRLRRIMTAVRAAVPG